MDMASTAVGLAPLGREKVLSIVGLSLDVAVERLVPDAPQAQRGAAVEAYRQAFMTRRIATRPPLYPGARDCLDALRLRATTCCLAWPPASRAGGLDAMIEHHESARLFRQPAHRRYPSLEAASRNAAGGLRRCRVDPSEAVMIGDTEFDMDIGAAAAAPPRLASAGAITRQRRWNGWMCRWRRISPIWPG